MSITLNQILDLVGKLDDTAGDETPRERFRKFLQTNVTKVDELRDHIEECLRTPGPQYNRALQDLVNHLGRFLGFSVTFGRYQGVTNELGYDGLWLSPTGFFVVVEVKTTEVYAVKTASLVGYVDGLISEKSIPSWESALGLYIVGRPDPEVRQLENAIVVEKRADQLRIVSVESILALADMMSSYEVEHQDILPLLLPSGPKVDPVITLMTRLVAQNSMTSSTPVIAVADSAPSVEKTEVGTGASTYWLTPVASDEEASAVEVIHRLVGNSKIYAFGEKTAGRKGLKPGDWICFYAASAGIVAHAKVASSPVKKTDKRVRHAERYPWVFRLENVNMYLDQPVAIEAELRQRMDAFRDKTPDQPWGFFVQCTRKVTEHDFNLLTRTDTVEH